MGRGSWVGLFVYFRACQLIAYGHGRLVSVIGETATERIIGQDDRALRSEACDFYASWALGRLVDSVTRFRDQRCRGIDLSNGVTTQDLR